MRAMIKTDTVSQHCTYLRSVYADVSSDKQLLITELISGMLAPKLIFTLQKCKQGEPMISQAH